MIAIDLNLLAVFDALYDLRSVTRAAQRLNLTQSAVSHALRRLRGSVGDPLFVRSGGALQPTARARAMAPEIREGLARLAAAMMPLEFDPARAVRTFTLAAGSYFCALLIPKLVARAREVAPGVTFRIVPVSAGLLAELDEGTVELALGAFDGVPERVTIETLFREDLVWIASRTNPICKLTLALGEVLRNPHLVIATRREFEPVRTLLAEGPLERQLLKNTHQGGAPTDGGPVSAIVYDGMTAVAVVAQTDMVALVPRRLARSEENRLGLRILETEEEGSGIDLAMISHSRASSDAGLAWLRCLIAELSK